MKHNQTVLSVRMSILLFAGMFICLLQSKQLAANPVHKVSLSKFYEDDKKPAKKGKSSKMQSAVKIVPDIFKRAMHVTARQGNEKEIDFFVFDVDGNMVLNYKMKAGEKKTVSGLKKGSYVYHVFCEDESIGTGQLDIR